MSGSSQPNTSAANGNNANNSQSAGQAGSAPNLALQLQEDDEFEDFPVEDWAREEEVGTQAHNTHLWEESWDDDDTTDDFAIQLKEELKKMDSGRRN